MLPITYGNRYNLNMKAAFVNGKQKRHEWEVYVVIGRPLLRKAQEFIEKVKFTLPTCYSDNVREVALDNSVKCKNSRSYFETKEAGWGSVNVQIEITFREVTGLQDYPLRLNHITVFKPGGCQKVAEVRLPRAAAEALRLVNTN